MKDWRLLRKSVIKEISHFIYQTICIKHLQKAYWKFKQFSTVTKWFEVIRFWSWSFKYQIAPRYLSKLTRKAVLRTFRSETVALLVSYYYQLSKYGRTNQAGLNFLQCFKHCSMNQDLVTEEWFQMNYSYQTVWFMSVKWNVTIPYETIRYE